MINFCTFFNREGKRGKKKDAPPASTTQPAPTQGVLSFFKVIVLSIIPNISLSENCFYKWNIVISGQGAEIPATAEEEEDVAPQATSSSSR